MITATNVAIDDDLCVFVLHNAGETRLIAGSAYPLPALDLPQPTAPLAAYVGRNALAPAPQRATAKRGLLRSLFGA